MSDIAEFFASRRRSTPRPSPKSALAPVGDARATSDGLVDALVAALEAVPHAVLVLDADRRVTLANRAARAVLERRDGLHLDSDGRLTTTLPADASALRELVGGSVSRGARRPRSVRIHRPGTGRTDLVAVVLADFEPHDRTSGADRTSRPSVLFVCDPEAAPTPMAEVIGRFGDVTPAELRVAACFAEGLTPRRIAERLEIEVSTAQTHLKNLRAKVGAGTQSQLMRLLLLGPMAGGDKQG
jgi:DNA-binding CsgD family transcriptional regulator